jgi:hypothetical protein
VAKRGQGGGSRRPEWFSVDRTGDGEVRITIPPAPPASPDEPPVMPLNPGWRWLSPLTLRVVRLLCASGWLSREEIAAELKEQPEGDIRPLLSDLVKRGVLESSGRKGYHVAIPEDADPEKYRRALAAWCDAEAKDLPDPST